MVLALIDSLVCGMQCYGFESEMTPPPPQAHGLKAWSPAGGAVLEGMGILWNGGYSGGNHSL